MTIGITILESGFICTIQDRGRYGFQRYGMPVSGPMDWYAFQAGNALLGNSPDAAGIEIGAEGIVFRVEGECLAVLCGMGYEIKVNCWKIPLWMVFSLKSGDVVKIVSTPSSGWVYLNFAGGVLTPLEMGSRSTYLRAKVGGYEGRALQMGDFLPLLPPTSIERKFAGRRWARCAIPPYGGDMPVCVVPGVNIDRFSLSSQNLFYSQTYLVRSDSDRMGYRLEGEPILHSENADILSSGLVTGAVQVPGNGKPIVMMADHPTTGGYAQIASVITADLPLLAQRMPGSGKVIFRQVTVEEAQLKYRLMMNQLKSGFVEDEDEIYRSEF